MLSVNVASEDKKFLIKYFVVRTNPQSACILVVGEYFPGLKGKTGNSMKISCPDFSHLLERKGVTPKMVEEILRWSFSESIEKTEQV